MLLIGSKALLHHFPHLDRTPSDTDYICTFDEFKQWTKDNKDIIKSCVPLSGDKFHVRTKDNWNIEFEIAWEGTSAEELLFYEEMWEKGCGVVNFASKETLLALKLSHRFLKNNPFFLKTMRDIQLLRSEGVVMSDWLVTYWLPKREKETYNYKHPKLDVSSKEFFTDDVPYLYSHDSIHKVVALDGKPAYTNYMKSGSEVMTSKEKFFSVSERIRLLGGVEEAMTLCAERSLIPYDFKPDPDKMFEFALQKLCTSISSGFFRLYCWENYDKILDIYNKECKGVWVDKLKKALDSGSVKLHNS